jgi:hypothetical protein
VKVETWCCGSRERTRDGVIPAVSIDIVYLLARVVVSVTNTRFPSRVEQRQRIADDRRMKTAPRRQRRYDHRLRDLVRRTGDLTIATDLGVPRSTARGWLAAAPAAVISVDVASRTEAELRQEILKLRHRVEKLAALLRWSSLCCKPPASGSQAHVCRREKRELVPTGTRLERGT